MIKATFIISTIAQLRIGKVGIKSYRAVRNIANKIVSGAVSKRELWMFEKAVLKPLTIPSIVAVKIVGPNNKKNEAREAEKESSGN